MATTTARPRTEPLASSPAPATPEEIRAAQAADEACRIPHELSAEAGVLGSIIIDPQIIGAALMLLPHAEAFFSDSNRKIFEALRDMYEKNTPIDAMTLYLALKKRHVLEEVGGLEYVKELANAVPTSAHSEYYAAQVQENYLKRRIISATTKSARECYDSGENAKTLLDRTEARVFEIGQMFAGKAEGAAQLGEGMYENVESIMSRTPGELTGIASGFLQLDHLTGGFQKGDMIVLAARPSVGKTSLAMDILSNVALNLQKPVGFLSMEMNKQSIGIRFLCARARVDSSRLKRGHMTTDDKQRLGEAMGVLQDAPIYVDDTSGLTAMDARTRMRRLVRNHGAELIAIDYLQLMQAGKRLENRNQEITYISSCLKACAQELGVPILVLSQLNRASENENRLPRMSDMRDSGSIEQDADVVMLLHREAVQRRADQAWRDANPEEWTKALMILAKQRNGMTGLVTLRFDEEYTLFSNG